MTQRHVERVDSGIGAARPYTHEGAPAHAGSAGAPAAGGPNGGSASLDDRLAGIAPTTTPHGVIAPGQALESDAVGSSTPAPARDGWWT